MLAFALRIHLGAGALHHAQPLHAQEVVVELGALDLDARRQVEHVLGVARLADLLAQAVELVDALGGRVVDRLPDGVGRSRAPDGLGNLFLARELEPFPSVLRRFLRRFCG